MPAIEVRTSSYSKCIAAAIMGMPQRGAVHSVFHAAANLIFPDGLILSLNAISSPRMPNGLQLSVPAGAFPFSALREGMSVLLGAQRLHIEAIDCSLDLSFCPQWDPQINRPEILHQRILRENAKHIARYVSKRNKQKTVSGIEHDAVVLSSPDNWASSIVGATLAVALGAHFSDILHLAPYLCGRGIGLTPTGDDILAGWMAAGWLIHGPEPNFVDTCQQIVTIARRQTHILSQCWLAYAAAGYVALPVVTLLQAMTREDKEQLEVATEAVLAMGATSGRDIIQGILLMKLDISVEEVDIWR